MLRLRERGFKPAYNSILQINKYKYIDYRCLIDCSIERGLARKGSSSYIKLIAQDAGKNTAFESI